MLNSVVSAIEGLLAFVDTHAGGPLDPSSLLTRDQIAELTILDRDFYAHCQLSGLSLSVIPEAQENGFCRFGNSRLPCLFGTIHLPFENEAGKVTQERVGTGMIIMPTPEWRHAMESLRATAALKAKAEEIGKTGSTLKPAGEDSSNKDEDDH